MIAIFKCVGLFFQVNYIIYRFTNEDLAVFELLNETSESATWGRLIYTIILPVPTLILFGIALYYKDSVCARFTLLILYMVESIVVMATPVVFARSVGVEKEWMLLVVTLLYITCLWPIRILCVYVVRGYYRELRYILHNREL